MRLTTRNPHHSTCPNSDRATFVYIELPTYTWWIAMDYTLCIHISIPKENIGPLPSAIYPCWRLEGHLFSLLLSVCLYYCIHVCYIFTVPQSGPLQLCLFSLFLIFFVLKLLSQSIYIKSKISGCVNPWDTKKSNSLVQYCLVHKERSCGIWLYSFFLLHGLKGVR